MTETDARHDLAALYRLCHHFGWTDLTSTHLSARVPGDAGHYLLNSHDLMFDEIRASNLSRMAFADGSSDSGRPVNMAGHLIHAAVLSARPEVNFVLHTHTRAGVAVSAMPGGLRPLSQHAGSILGSLATHPYRYSPADADERAALAADLGGNYAMILQNHGLLTVGRTAAEAFTYHYYLEMACKIQVDILSACADPIEIPSDALEPLLDWGRPGAEPLGAEPWPALMRLVKRKYPDYAD